MALNKDYKKRYKAIKKKYIQYGKHIKKPKGKVLTEHMCKNRDKCLEIAFRPGYHVCILACNDCPYKDIIEFGEKHDS